MPTILSIDHTHFLIPDSVNINTLVKAFEKVKLLKWDYERGGSREWFEVDRAPRIEIKIVPKDQIREPKKAKQIPEKAGPDCNGRMV